MTGKQLKDWAAQIHDEAIIEYDQIGLTYRHVWQPIAPDMIRASHITQPSAAASALAACNNLEDSHD